MTCPLGQIVQEIPDDVVHLDVGCGHGVLLALMHRRCPKQTLMGIDISSDKIGQAKLSENKTTAFRVESIDLVHPNSVDSISIVDVLYLVPVEKRHQFLEACASALRPHGRLLIKETGTKPFWKYAFLLTQEFFAVKVLRITQGSVIKIVPERGMMDLIALTGFETPFVKRLDRGYPYPHVCFITRKLA